MSEPKLIANRIKCLLCGDIISSVHQHDFKMCSCGKVGVDGGLSYLRRVGDKRHWKEMSEWENETITSEQAAESLKKVRLADRMFGLNEALNSGPHPPYTKVYRKDRFFKDPIDEAIEKIKQI